LDFSPRFASALKMDDKHGMCENPNGLLSSNINEIAGHSALNDGIKYSVCFFILKSIFWDSYYSS